MVENEEGNDDEDVAVGPIPSLPLALPPLVIRHMYADVVALAIYCRDWKQDYYSQTPEQRERENMKTKAALKGTTTTTKGDR